MEALIFIIVIVAYMSAPVVFLLALEISNRKEKRREKKQKAYQQHIEDLEMQIEIKEYQKRWVKAWRKKYMPDDPRVTFDEAFENVLRSLTGSKIPVQVRIPPMPEVKKPRKPDTIQITGSTLDNVPLKVIECSLNNRGYTIVPIPSYEKGAKFKEL